MSENFRKIKKKYLTVAIAAACILGACLGVALTCTLAVIFKSCGLNVHWAVYIPVAIALSAGAGTMFFFILRPDDTRIAKKLDRDFALNQKVQTMVEFANVEGDMPALQREQTDEVLGAVAKKRVDLKWLLKFAFIPVLALAMLFAGIFVPAKKSGYVDQAFNMSSTHKNALVSLKRDVEGSSLETGLKTFVVLELDGLLDMLEKAEYESAMRSAITDAVRNIDKLVSNANSYLITGRTLQKDETLAPFAKAVINSVVDYKIKAVLTDMSKVREMEAEVDDAVAAVLTKWETSHLKKLSEDSDAAIKFYEFALALADKLEDGELVKLYAPAGGAEGQSAARALRSADGDRFYNLLVSYAETLAKHGEDVLEGRSSLNAEGLFNNLISDSAPELGKQSYNCMMDEFIRNRLARIFGISLPNLDDVAPYPSQDSDGGDKKPDSSSEGGYSDGKRPYGSNDEILDPDTGESKKYGDKINPNQPNSETYHDKYYNMAINYLSNPDCPPEIAAFIRNYFDYLEKEQENKD